MPDSAGRPRLSWLRRLLGHARRQPPIGGPVRDGGRETLRVQLGLIRDAFDGSVGVAGGRGEADVDYLYRPGQVLTSREGVDQLTRFFAQRDEAPGEVVEVLADLFRFELPPGRDVPRTLDEVDVELGERVATPDHLLYVTGSVGKACPATEPELPLPPGPVPRLSKDAGAGKDVRISVVDTGWWPEAANDTDTPWLAQGVDGDLEQIDKGQIHPYGGHGTFVAGVLRCLAPAATVRVEGFLTQGGAMYESEIAKQLHDAMQTRPQIISISAGAHTRNNQPLKGFEAWWAAHRKKVGEDETVLVVAAAGNDGNDVQFWPAAFDWVVGVGSLDADGTLSDFSNHGDWVDVYAQGRDLVNAFPSGTYKYYEPTSPLFGKEQVFSGLARWSGTSFSTPIVTGAIAAYMSEHGISARQAGDKLLAAAPTKQDKNVGTYRVVGPPFVP